MEFAPLRGTCAARRNFRRKRRKKKKNRKKKKATSTGSGRWSCGGLRRAALEITAVFCGHGRWFFLEVFIGFSIWRLNAITPSLRRSLRRARRVRVARRSARAAPSLRMERRQNREDAKTRDMNDDRRQVESTLYLGATRFWRTTSERADTRREVGVELMTRTMGNILTRGGGRDHASRTGKMRNECDLQANRLHVSTSPCTVGTVPCMSDRAHFRSPTSPVVMES